MEAQRMVLSQMLEKVVANRDLLDNELFCELLSAAWDDCQTWFYRFYHSQRDNGLFGLKTQVEGPTGNCLRDCNRRDFPSDHRKSWNWEEVLRMVRNIEAGIDEEWKVLD